MSLSDPVPTKDALWMDQLHNILIGLSTILGYVGYSQNSWLMVVMGAVSAAMYSVASSVNIHKAITNKVNAAKGA